MARFNDATGERIDEPTKQELAEVADANAIARGADSVAELRRSFDAAWSDREAEVADQLRKLHEAHEVELNELRKAHEAVLNSLLSVPSPSPEQLTAANAEIERLTRELDTAHELLTTATQPPTVDPQATATEPKKGKSK